MFSFFKKLGKKKEEPKKEEEIQVEVQDKSKLEEPLKKEVQKEVEVIKEEKPQEELEAKEVINKEIPKDEVNLEVELKEIDNKVEIKEEKQEEKQEEKEEEKEEIKDEVKEELEDNSKKGFFSKALSKTVGNLKSIIPKKQIKIDFDTVEELLIEADVEYEIVEKAMDGLPEQITRAQLRHRLVSLFEHISKEEIKKDINEKPFVDLIIGVNGAGKTTTIAKLANLYKQDGKKVLLGAGDTFRAAAIEQLSIWADKLDIPIIKTKQGHDASAVAFDTIHSGVAKKVDNVIIDTAGRLQTQVNLANELKKIVNVCNKAYEGAPHRKIMILDGTQGNSAIAQAKAFNEMISIDGIIVTKLDGTAKGGALFSIANQLELPIYYIGIGEKENDLIVFDEGEFVDSLLDELYI